jgi:hypothetical protein
MRFFTRSQHRVPKNHTVMPSTNSSAGTVPSRGELEQIRFLLGHASVETTERYLGCKQKLSHAVNDNLGLEDT